MLLSVALDLWGHLPLLTHPSSTGRDLKENLEALEEFKEFTQKKGLIPENLVVPEQMGENTMLPSLSPVSPVTLSLLRPLSPMWTLQALLQVLVMGGHEPWI